MTKTDALLANRVTSIAMLPFSGLAIGGAMWAFSEREPGMMLFFYAIALGCVLCAVGAHVVASRLERERDVN